MESHRRRAAVVPRHGSTGNKQPDGLFRMARWFVTAAVLSSTTSIAVAPASLADDRALVARTTALLSMYRSVRGAADTQRDVVSTRRAATARALRPIDILTHSGDSLWTTIRRVSTEYRIPIRIILAVIAAESAFDPRAVSRAGARGLMQVMPATARDIGVDPNDLFDPCINVHAGTRYMRVLADSFGGRTRDVLAAYNAGPQRVLSRRRLPGETVIYLRRVEAYFVTATTDPPPEWRERLASACGAS